MIATGLAAFVLGICLTHFNALSIVVATVICAGASLTLSSVLGWTLFDSILVCIIALVELQTGYLGGVMLRASRS